MLSHHYSGNLELNILLLPHSLFSVFSMLLYLPVQSINRLLNIPFINIFIDSKSVFPIVWRFWHLSCQSKILLETHEFNYPTISGMSCLLQYLFKFRYHPFQSWNLHGLFDCLWKWLKSVSDWTFRKLNNCLGMCYTYEK